MTNKTSTNDSTSICGRISITLGLLGFLVPLVNVVSFNNDPFLGKTNLPSIGLLFVYCCLASVQGSLIVMKKPIDDYERLINSLFLVSGIVLTSLMYHDSYQTGIDGIKNYILNLMGLSISVISFIYEMVKERQNIR